jgi:transcription elongation factor Elf1
MGSYQKQKKVIMQLLKSQKVFECQRCNMLIAACRMKDERIRSLINKNTKLFKARAELRRRLNG